MTGQFFADPDRLRALAPQFDEVGADVSGAVQQLRETLAAEGAPWGDDEAGRSFSDSYLPEYRQTMSDLDSLVEVFEQSGGDIRQLADNLEAQDRTGGTQVAEVANRAEQAMTSPITVNHAVPQSNSEPARTRPLTPVVGPGVATPNATPVKPGPDAARHPAATASKADRPDAGDSPDGRQQQRSGPDASGTGSEGAPNGETTQAPSGASPRSVSDAREIGRSGRGTAGAGGAAVAPGRAEAGPANNTPWSRRAATTAPIGSNGAKAPGASGPPKVAAPEQNSSAPPRAPVRPTPRPGGKAEKAEATAKPPDRSTESIAARLRRELAERHDVSAFGFETPGVPEGVLREIVAAVDHVLPRFPEIALRAVGIGELPDGEPVRLEWVSQWATVPHDRDDGVSSGAGEPDSPEGTVAKPGAKIIVAAAAATDPERLRQVTADAEFEGTVAPGCSQRPVFAAVVRAFGGALDDVGGRRARPVAQRTLLTAYRPLLPPESSQSVRRMASAYREWRSQLRGRSLRRGRFDPAEALAEAFTEVELNASLAVPPAHVLHRLLVSVARSADATSNDAGSP